ncbi:MAG: hypothetical protein NTW16_18430 [Bacteroidetes bacterium]|nr:hypothetical protein [Bacteroidota bacterium]
MKPERKNRIQAFAGALIVCLILLANASIAQLSCSASIKSCIVSPDDIAGMSLSSSDGTQFLLKNGSNSCFDVSIEGLQPVLRSANSEQKVRYSLSFDQYQSVSFDVISLRLNILFTEAVKNGTYLASAPFTISVHYN